MKKSDFDGMMRGLAEAQTFARGKKPPGTRIHIPKDVDVAKIRAGTGHTQSSFAAQIGGSVATLRNWEQGRRQPEGPALVLLALLRSDPEIVQRMLSAA